MLGARIDVLQPQIRNVIVYLLPLPDEKPMLWLNVIKRADWTGTIVKHGHICSTHFLSEMVK